jgi:hypothetical protein
MYNFLIKLYHIFHNTRLEGNKKKKKKPKKKIMHKVFLQKIICFIQKKKKKNWLWKGLKKNSNYYTILPYVEHFNFEYICT